MKKASSLGGVVKDPWLWAALSLALALRLSVTWYVPVMVPDPSYAGAARAVASGQPLLPTLARGLRFDMDPLRTPTYPVFLAVLTRAAGIQSVWFALGQHLLGLLTAVLVYLLARRLGGPVAAGAAVFLFVLDLNYPLYESCGYSETLMAPLVLASVYGAVLLLDRRRSSFAVALGTGLASGLAILCRPEFALFPILLLLFLSFANRGDRALLRRGYGAAGLCLLLVGGWMTRNLLRCGRFILTSNAGITLLQRTTDLVNYASLSYPEAKAALRDAQDPRYRSQGDIPHVARDLLCARYGWSQPKADGVLCRVWLEAVRAHPGQYLELTLQNLRSLFFPDAPEIFGRYRRLLLERWPRPLAAAWSGSGYFDKARTATDAACALEYAAAWLAVPGLILSLSSVPAAFTAAAYLCLMLSVAASAIDFRYRFEMQAFQMLLAALAASWLWNRLRSWAKR